MTRLPASLERRLAEVFPDPDEREQFIAEAIEAALEEDASQDSGPMSIGGTLHLFTDGGSRGNPGEAAIAFILEDPNSGTVIEEKAKTIGIETNNVAEYQALIEGLRAAKRYLPNRLICHLDSELVVRQLNGEYQVKMPSLKVYVDEVRAFIAELPDVVFMHIPREDNYRADKLVNQALDAAGTKKKLDRKSTRLNSSHSAKSRMPSSA